MPCPALPCPAHLDRRYAPVGSILIDGLDTRQLPLARVRSAVALIPQDPLLFRGTLRSNLDPFALRSDEQLWAALERAK